MNRALVSNIFLALSVVLTGCAQKKDPLLRATQDGDVGTVRALLEGGSDVNQRDQTARTPLMYATIKNHKEVVQVLLDKGADVNARNNSGETALTLAARDGHPEIAQALLRKGADVNVVDSAGMAPVVYAAQFNHPATLKVLLEEGRADVSGKQGELALRAGTEHPDLIEMLRKAGAKN